MSAGANPSTSTKGITYDVAVELTVCAEESLGSELFRAGVFSFVAGHGPGEGEFKYCGQHAQRMSQPSVHDDCHSYHEN